MDATDIRRMVSMVRAIRAGKWTHDLPSWANHLDVFNLLQEMPEDGADEYRAVQTAETFLLLAHASRFPLDETKFLRDCGFLG